MVQQPDRDNEEEEDDGCDDQGHESVDTPAREVADFRVKRFRGGFLTGEKFSVGIQLRREIIGVRGNEGGWL